jgi:hypothetical protein
LQGFNHLFARSIGNNPAIVNNDDSRRQINQARTMRDDNHRFMHSKAL